MPKISDKELNMAFNMPPEDIINFFKDKGLKPSFDWHEVYADAHAKAFTVAKMTELDLLKDTKKLLEKTLEEGKSYSEFKREATNLFEQKGWTGFKKVTDPKTGEEKTVELGTPRRIKKIYYTNMQSAYAVGRYKEMLEEADVAPYWQYMAIMDERTRPEHQAMHQKVYKADDPFWSVFYPPNGWGCRCFVRNLTKGDFERSGLKLEKTDGKFSTVNVKVGDEIKEIPVYKFNDGGIERVLKPDAGWETNLSIKAWGIDVQAWNKAMDMPEKIKFDFIAQMASNPHNEKGIIALIDKMIQNNFIIKTTPEEKTLTWFTPEILKALQKENYKLISPIVTFEERQVKHSLSDVKVEKQRLTETQLKNIYKYIQNADEIYIDTEELAVVYVKFLPKDEIIENRDCIKIPIIINSIKKKRPVNYVGTTGRINHKNTFGGNQKRYKKIE